MGYGAPGSSSSNSSVTCSGRWSRATQTFCLYTLRLLLSSTRGKCDLTICRPSYGNFVTIWLNENLVILVSSVVINVRWLFPHPLASISAPPPCFRFRTFLLAGASFVLSYDAFLELWASEHSYDAFLGLSHPWRSRGGVALWRYDGAALVWRYKVLIPSYKDSKAWIGVVTTKDICIFPLLPPRLGNDSWYSLWNYYTHEPPP